jgi:beta-lactamase class A
MVMPMPAVMPVAPAKPRPLKRVHASTAKANAGVRYITGMDGIRRAVPVGPREAALSPRTVLQNMTAAPAMAMRPLADAEPVFADTADELAASGWHAPAWRMPSVRWGRPAIAFGLVATALVASTVTVRAIAAPPTVTAHAETAAPAAVAPTPAVKAPVVAPTPQKTGLQQILDDFVAANGSHFEVVVKDLKTGETATINPDQSMTSASLYKLFVAQRIYQRIDLGELDYGKAAGGGSGRTVDGCLTVMINISDNTCGRALGGILGWGAENQALKAEGYTGTSLTTPQQTSARDVSMLFERLYKGTLVSPNSSQKFMGLLKDQRVNNRLPQGLPGGTVIAHKTGDLDGVVHDAGIVYGPKTDYLVTVMSGPWSMPGNSPAMFADLSSKLWNYFEN